MKVTYSRRLPNQLAEGSEVKVIPAGYWDVEFKEKLIQVPNMGILLIPPTKVEILGEDVVQFLNVVETHHNDCLQKVIKVINNKIIITDGEIATGFV